MTKAKTAKYPTLRMRCSQELYDFAYNNGWPNSVKNDLQQKMDKQNAKKAKTSAVNSSK